MAEMEPQQIENPGTQGEAMTPAVERAILASISEGVMVMDGEGRVGQYNRSAAQMLGLDPQPVPALSVGELLAMCSDYDRLAVLEAVERLRADPYTYGMGPQPPTNVHLDEKTIEIRLAPVLSQVGEFSGIVAVLRDITDLLEAKQAGNDFIHHVNHEMRSPLTAVKGFSELLRRQILDRLEDQEKHFLGVIQDNADRLDRLLSDLVTMSDIDCGRLGLEAKPVRLDEVIREVADAIRLLCDEKSQRLVVDIEPHVGPVLGDRLRLTQVVNTLARNACRHTGPGGRIALSLSRAQDAVRVDVSDTGIGLSPEKQARVFQRFYRPEGSKSRGANLGLPLAKSLVEIHGGRLWVESEQGKGSTFSFVLPLQTAAPDEEGIVMEEAPGKYTVLVVEDDPDVAQLIQLQLEQEGFRVFKTERGEEALELANTHKIDLVTLDIMLPDIMGTEVLARLKANPATAGIPVVIVSVMKPEGVGRLDVADHLTKPFSLDKLLLTIRRALPVG
jgi:PAS domain S-box-containing protein